MSFVIVPDPSAPLEASQSTSIFSNPGSPRHNDKEEPDTPRGQANEPESVVSFLGAETNTASSPSSVASSARSGRTGNHSKAATQVLAAPHSIPPSPFIFHLPVCMRGCPLLSPFQTWPSTLPPPHSRTARGSDVAHFSQRKTKTLKMGADRGSWIEQVGELSCCRQAQHIVAQHALCVRMCRSARRYGMCWCRCSAKACFSRILCEGMLLSKMVTRDPNMAVNNSMQDVAHRYEVSTSLLDVQ
jgi:hypothetical protein